MVYFFNFRLIAIILLWLLLLLSPLAARHVGWPRNESAAPAVEAQNPNPWIARKVSISFLKTENQIIHIEPQISESSWRTRRSSSPRPLSPCGHHRLSCALTASFDEKGLSDFCSPHPSLILCVRNASLPGASPSSCQFSYIKDKRKKNFPGLYEVGKVKKNACFKLKIINSACLCVPKRYHQRRKPDPLPSVFFLIVGVWI